MVRYVIIKLLLNMSFHIVSINGSRVFTQDTKNVSNYLSHGKLAQDFQTALSGFAELVGVGHLIARNPPCLFQNTLFSFTL